MRTKHAWLYFALAVVWLATSLTPALAQNRSAREVYTGNIFYFGGPRGTISTNFTLTITGYTPPAEVDSYISILQRGGQDELMKAIDDKKLGTMQIGAQVGRDINAVWVSTDEEEGRKLTILFERWIGFGELRRGARSLDYPFTYVEIYLDEKGNGDGAMIPAARIRHKRGQTIEVENFGIYPARLTNVRRSR
jgi:hypothetical protein